MALIIRQSTLTNKLLVRVLAAWREQPGFDNFQVGDAVETLQPGRGWLKGTVTRVRPEMPKEYGTRYRTYSIQVGPGDIQIGHAPLMCANKVQKSNS